MHANVYSFWGQVEPRTEPSRQQRGKKSKRRDEHIRDGLRGCSVCSGPMRVNHIWMCY